MKKLLLGVCLIVVIVIAGCVSTKLAFVFDTEIPEDQMSFLWVPNYAKVTQFDGKTVAWMTNPLFETIVKVGVPSGEHTFMLDSIVLEKNLAGVPNIKNKSYTHNFETGIGYQLILRGNEIVIITLK